MGLRFGGNPLAAAAAVVTLEIIQRPGFLENVRTVGAYLLTELCKLQSAYEALADVRGLGLMLG